MELNCRTGPIIGHQTTPCCQHPSDKKNAEDKISKTIITFDSRCLPLIATLIWNQAKRLNTPSLIITGKALQRCTFISFFRIDNHHTVFAPFGKSFTVRISEWLQKQDVYHTASKTALFSSSNTFPPDHRFEIR